MITYTIKDLGNNEKPRERLVNLGSHALSDSELLAIILQSGGKDESVLDLSRKLLVSFNGYKGLREASVEQLKVFKNIGMAKAVAIIAVCEIALRLNLSDEKEIKYVKFPKDAFNILKKDLFGKKREELYLISLDSRNKVIAKDRISIGTVNETIVHPREVFRQALLRNAVSIVLIHNHPSQETTPSSEDLIVTETIAKAGGLLGIALVDHIIISNTEYCSLKALGVFKTKKFNRGEVK